MRSEAMSALVASEARGRGAGGFLPPAELKYSRRNKSARGNVLSASMEEYDGLARDAIRRVGAAAPGRCLQHGALADTRCSRCRGRRTGRLRTGAEIRRLAPGQRWTLVVPHHRQECLLRLAGAQQAERNRA